MPGNTKTKSQGGGNVFHPQKKTSSVEMETRNRKLKKGKRQNGGHERFPGGKHLRKCRKPLPLRRSAPFPGTEQAVPWRAPFGAPHSPSLTLGPVLSPMTPCAAMWSARSPAGHTKKTDVVLKIPNVRWATGKRLTNPLPKPSPVSYTHLTLPTILRV